MEVTLSSPVTTPRLVLFNFVRSILNGWDGYQIALLNSSGGAETPEKDKWLCDEITRLLIETSDLEIDDLMYWLAEVFDDNFDLILEDDSIPTTARLLLDSVKTVRQRFGIF